MARRTTGLNWIMWSSACPALASLTLLIPALNNQSQWGLKQGQRQGRRCCTEQIITARENTMRDLGMWLDRQDVNTQPRTHTHTHTHLMVYFTSAAYDGLRWTVWKKSFQQNFWLPLQIPICKRIISSINQVFQDLDRTLCLQYGQLSVFLPDTTFV